MRTIKKIRELQKFSHNERAAGRSVAFVPTMGYLHDGHLALVHDAKRRCERVIVSIFVNPLQFGPAEDLDRYPRDIERDSALLEQAGVDVLFLPDTSEMYPEGFATRISVEGLTHTLCGASRPGHFTGVATVVAKLLNAALPDIAIFGEKDFQQLAVIRRMAKDLNSNVEIVGAPIVREPDGLAMSSRNSYLSPDERISALCLHKAVAAARQLVSSGCRDAATILAACTGIVEATPLTRIDYIHICDPDTLAYVEDGTLPGRALLALAVFVGATRVIDNTILEA